jgi:glycosyltransferase involved in cell wall biosynthesis
MTRNRPLRALVELRPAFDGHAGIPQETRLLFRGLRQLDDMKVDGLLQSSQFLLAKGLPVEPGVLADWAPDKRINRLSRVVISAQPGRSPTRLEKWKAGLQVASTLVGGRQALSAFDARWHADFIWRALFAKTLPPSDFDAVTRADFRIARLPWGLAHRNALGWKPYLRTPLFPRVDTRGYDIFISETPYPGRVDANTRLVVRYHDAIPILMPHSIGDRSSHQASHYHALRRNVRDGAWFACVSDAVRRDLLALFPEVESRSETIHNMVSHHYAVKEPAAHRVADILRLRRSAALAPKDGGRETATSDMTHGSAHAAPSAAPGEPASMRYLLMVSTIEPRKNHLGLLAAWERLRHAGHSDLQLVVVGAAGWDSGPILAKFKPWVGQGGLHVIEDVPSDELRVLYQHAAATVCPSFGEGFDFSGVEGMQCGSVVAASDIAVHQEVYGPAAEYFNPYDPEDAANRLAALLHEDAAPRRAALVEQGRRVAACYRSERLLPQWSDFLARATSGRLSHAVNADRSSTPSAFPT